MSLGGWAEAAKYRPVLVLIGAPCAIAAVTLGGRRLVLWRRKRRLARESRSSESEIAFREGFHSAADGFVVNTELTGSKGLIDVRDAVSAKFAGRIVAFSEIVEWLSRGAPDPISGNQAVPRAALRKFRQESMQDWIEPEQMAAQLVGCEFLFSASNRAKIGIRTPQVAIPWSGWDRGDPSLIHQQECVEVLRVCGGTDACV